MEQYIPKSVVLTEIEKLMGNPELIEDWRYRVKMEEKNELLKSIINTINTLEVKDVNLEEYYHKFLQKEWFGNSHVRTMSEMMAFTARHFFELGLKAQKREEV